jgi:hypothetical protein
MAVLSVDTLTGCSSIPSFLGGTSDTPANPSITVFHNTSAPTNWTKNTSSSINNIALRVIGGAEGVGISTGGTLPFSTVFSPKTSPISSSPSPAGSSFEPATSAILFTQTGGLSIATQDVSFGSGETPPHTHPYVNSPTTSANVAPGGSQRSLTSPGTTSGPGAGPGTHNHGNMSAPHSHSITDSGHTHPVNAIGAHTHAFTLNQNFDISYVDVIIATKD